MAIEQFGNRIKESEHLHDRKWHFGYGFNHKIRVF
jgi:hypothetical protein